MFPLLPPVVKTPEPSLNSGPIRPAIFDNISSSIKVANGASSCVYMEVWQRAAMISPPNADGVVPPKNWFMKAG